MARLLRCGFWGWETSNGASRQKPPRKTRVPRPTLGLLGDRETPNDFARRAIAGQIAYPRFEPRSVNFTPLEQDRVRKERPRAGPDLIDRRTDVVTARIGQREGAGVHAAHRFGEEALHADAASATPCSPSP